MLEDGQLQAGRLRALRPGAIAAAFIMAAGGVLLTPAPGASADTYGTSATRTLDPLPPEQTRMVATPRSAAAQRALFLQRMSGMEERHPSVPLPGDRLTAPFAEPRRGGRGPSMAPASDVPPRQELSASAGGANGPWRVHRRTSVTRSAGIRIDHASVVSEPTAAAAGDIVLATGNWFAALSTDGGKSFKPLSPYARFGRGTFGNRFCCDQLALYNRKHDVFFWFQQGASNARGNVSKLFVGRRGAKPGEEPLEWTGYVFASTTEYDRSNVELDFPDMAFNDRYLFITSNVYSTVGDLAWLGTVMMRIPLEQLAEGRAITYQSWRTNKDLFSYRFARGAKTGMYFGTHWSTTDAVVEYWDDDKPEPDMRRFVRVRQWEVPSAGSVAVSAAPNGKPWMLRHDDRMSGGFDLGDKVGFAWTSGSLKGFRQPHTRVFLISKAALAAGTQSVTLFPEAEPLLWNESVAFADLTGVVNDKGQLAIGFTFGGPDHYPSYGVGVLERAPEGEYRWRLATVANGRGTPKCFANGKWDETCGDWGDYFRIHPHGSRPDSWVTVGYTVQSADKAPLEAESVYLHFGYDGAAAGATASDKR